MTYILNFHFNNRIKQVILPNLNNNKIAIKLDKQSTELEYDIMIPFEIWDKKWQLGENTEVLYECESKRCSNNILYDGMVINCTYKQKGEKFTIIVEEINRDLVAFNKFTLHNRTKISIGKDKNNTIQYVHEFVSGTHIVIESDRNGGHILKDYSKNGTFINGKRVNGSQELCYGDVIFIVGLKIIYLKEVLAINQPEGLEVTKELEKYLLEQVDEEVEDYKEWYYSRSPRHISRLDLEEVDIDAVPNPNKEKRQPLIFTIGPSITMTIPMFAGVLFTMWSNKSTGNQTSPFMFMGIVTSITSAAIGIGWTLANLSYRKKVAKQEEELRCNLYEGYLDKVKRLIEDKHNNNREILEEMYPITYECLKWGTGENSRLWERNVNHEDFLSIRIGVGNSQCLNKVNVPKQRFSMINDKIAEQPFEIKETYKDIKHIPICISLKEQKLVGVISKNKDKLYNVANIMLAQLAAHHSYTDVKLVYISNKFGMDLGKNIKWLPHTWTNDEKLRLVADDEVGIGEVLHYLSHIVRERLEAANTTRLGKTAKVTPHYVIFIENMEIVQTEPIMKYLLEPVEGMGITTVILGEHIDSLPNNCTFIVQNDETYRGYYSIDNSVQGINDIEFDVVAEQSLEEFARSISGVRVRQFNSSGSIPQNLSFLDMYHVKTIEELEIRKRWLQNRTYESMKAVIGFKGNNKPVYLDIHEKYHGPHGLVAGTTGSGKSETLQAYILSLVVNYHPYEVAFVLIDYKGGGMADSFKGLPHIAGIITNLEGNQTNRALASINSEIKRRQAVFRKYNVKHIDTYIELFRDGKVDEPMPHLIIIADEFAELKNEQPEFVKSLVSAARVGRSLGVNLILATQKPTGVVDDEISSNAKFRLCLRVQDKSDSNEMLKRPDAAYITSPGRGFFQVGNDEIFEEFQSGYSGARYDEEATETHQYGEVKLINLQGKACVIEAVENDKSGKVSQLEAIVSYISELSDKLDLGMSNNIWLPPLPDKIYLEELDEFKLLVEKAQSNEIKLLDGLKVILGKIDAPNQQKQYTGYFDLMEEGNVLVAGSSGSGKTTFLQTMLYTLTRIYSANLINVYIADFGGRMLGVFRALPQVGDVIFEDDIEKFEKLLKILLQEMKARKHIFAENGVGNFKEYLQIKDDMPLKLLVIDDFENLREACEHLVEPLRILSREAVSYGIYTVITCINPYNLPTKVLQNFKYGLGLQLADKHEYEAAVGEKTDVVVAPKVKGRGLVKCPIPLEVQIALCKEVKSGQTINHVLLEEFRNLPQDTQNYVKSIDDYEGIEVQGTAQKANVSHVVTNVVNSQAVANNTLNYQEYTELEVVQKARKDNFIIPYGVTEQKDQIVGLDLMKGHTFCISGQPESGKTNTMQVILNELRTKEREVYIIDTEDKTFKELSEQYAVNEYVIPEKLSTFMINKLIPAIQERVKVKKENPDIEMKEFLKGYPPIFIMISDLTKLTQYVHSKKDNTKDILTKLMHKDTNIGIFIIAEINSTSIVACTRRPLVSNFTEMANGIHLGAVMGQGIFEFDLSTSDKIKRIPVGYGYTNQLGKTHKVVIPKM